MNKHIDLDAVAAITWKDASDGINNLRQYLLTAHAVTGDHRYKYTAEHLKKTWDDLADMRGETV